MGTVYFATSNQEKMLIAHTVCSKFNINVEQASIDNEKNIAEVFERGEKAIVERYQTRPDAWHGFADWYKSEPKE